MAIQQAAISRAPRPLHGRSGRMADHQGLAVVVSDVDGTPRGTRAELLAHFAVIEEIAGARTVLPFRFGMLFRSDDEVLERVLRPRVDALGALLREMDGFVELTVKAAYREDAILREIVQEQDAVRQLRRRTSDRPPDASHFERI